MENPKYSKVTIIVDDGENVTTTVFPKVRDLRQRIEMLYPEPVLGNPRYVFKGAEVADFHISGMAEYDPASEYIGHTEMKRVVK